MQYIFKRPEHQKRFKPCPSSQQSFREEALSAVTNECKGDQKQTTMRRHRKVAWYPKFDAKCDAKCREAIALFDILELDLARQSKGRWVSIWVILDICLTCTKRKYTANKVFGSEIDDVQWLPLWDSGIAHGGVRWILIVIWSGMVTRSRKAGGRDARAGVLCGGRQILTRSEQHSLGWHLESPCRWLLSIHCFLFFELCFRVFGGITYRSPYA